MWSQLLTFFPFCQYIRRENAGGKGKQSCIFNRKRLSVCHWKHHSESIEERWRVEKAELHLKRLD